MRISSALTGIADFYDLTILLLMLFSKSYDYALRGILYIASQSDVKQRVQIGEIARRLTVPRHFLSKIMNKLVKKGILHSTKGPFGGFSVNSKTMNATLLDLLQAVDGIHPFNSCVLKEKKCSASRPCPLHERMSHLRDSFLRTMEQTTISELLINKPALLKRLLI